MRSLSDTSAGRFAVLTLSGSIYTLDLDQRVFGRGGSLQGDDRGGDSDLIHLIAVISCEVGAPMMVLIDYKIPGIESATRNTTPVVLIQPLPPVGSTPQDEL